MQVEHERGVWISADADALGHQLSYARLFVKEAASDIGVPEPEVASIALAVHEAVANAIEHGEPCNGDGAGRVELKIWLEASCAIFTIRDCGSFSFDPSSGTELLDERGRGLLLMDALMDRVEVVPEQDRTVVRLEKHL